MTVAQARRMIDRGELAQAKAVLTRALAKNPSDLDANLSMSFVCAKTGDFVRAVYYAEKCAAALPDDPRVHCNLGRALIDSGRTDEAAARLEQAAERLPPFPELLHLLTSALHQAGRPDEAVAWARRGLEALPGDVPLLLNLAASALVCGCAAEAVECCREAVGVDPRHAGALSHLLSSLNYADLEIQHAASERHEDYGRLIGTLYGPAPAWEEVDRDPDRPLRIGILSPDLRTHAVSYFAEPVLRHHDRDEWSLTVYSTANPEDARSEQLKRLVGSWRRLSGMTFADAARAIRADRIDVLIDLAGHTNGHALPALHLRAAPVQMTWIGYPHSTGVRAVAWRITDSAVDPEAGPWPCVESPLRLDPCFLVWEPPQNIPEPAPSPPMTARGRVTFGSFAAVQKLSHATVRLWSRAVNAVPGSRLLFKSASLKSAGVRSMVLERFAAAGLDPSRIDLEPPGRDAAEMMPRYADMDISLDTFPYTGTTTTCECLWMGVPMVTLEGPAGVPASRVSASIIRAVVGVNDANRMIAGSEDAFVSAAAGLAGDVAALSAWRGMTAAGLRPRMARSPLRDGPGRCRQMEQAVRGAWRAWCAGA